MVWSVDQWSIAAIKVIWERKSVISPLPLPLLLLLTLVLRMTFCSLSRFSGTRFSNVPALFFCQFDSYWLCLAVIQTIQLIFKSIFRLLPSIFLLWTVGLTGSPQRLTWSDHVTWSFTTDSLLPPQLLTWQLSLVHSSSSVEATCQVLNVHVGSRVHFKRLVRVCLLQWSRIKTHISKISSTTSIFLIVVQ